MNLQESIQWAKDQEEYRKNNPPVCNNPEHWFCRKGGKYEQSQ